MPEDSATPDAAASDPDAVSAPPERRHTLPIPDDAAEDIPLKNTSEVKALSVQDPAGDHRRGMDKTKLIFGIKLIAGCLIVYVALTVLQYLTQSNFENSAPLTSALDLLKLIATTALGFVFGRTLDDDKKG